jgi:hypothetical protein
VRSALLKSAPAKSRSPLSYRRISSLVSMTWLGIIAPSVAKDGCDLTSVDTKIAIASYLCCLGLKGNDP